MSDDLILPRHGDANAAAPLALEIVSDVVCPWCYIGKRRLEQALALLGKKVSLTLRWRPYELNPDMPATGMDRETYCVRKFGSLDYAQKLYANVAANAHADGLALNHERIKRTPNTRAAHRLILLAERHGVQDEIVDGLFAAYFVEGRDIGDPQVLLEIAVAAGIAREVVSAFLAGDEGNDEITRQETAAHRLGIQGVPAFVLNGRLLFSGAQPPAVIAETLATILPRSRVVADGA